jgi:hypothetical protein
MPGGIRSAELAGLEERWGCRLAGDMTPEAEHAAEATGGALLFGLAGRLLGGDEALASALGRGWATGETWLTEESRTGSGSGAVPAPLRPLLALAVLGVRDARDAAAGRARVPRASAGRQLRMFAAIAFGR